MPYLTEDEKKLLDGGSIPQTCGHLTYLIFRTALDNYTLDKFDLLQDAVDKYLPANPKFEDFAKVLGSIYAAALEMERRYFRTSLALYDFAANFYKDVIGPYEDKKIEQNGDVI